MVAPVCMVCGEFTENARGSRPGFCWNCWKQHSIEQRTAVSAIARAVLKGEMPRAKELTCVDCAKPAYDYDHRDYTKPLDVVPVCRSCNLKRGPAFNSFWRPDSTHPRIVAALSRACYGHADDQPK